MGNYFQDLYKERMGLGNLYSYLWVIAVGCTSSGGQGLKGAGGGEG